MISNRRAFTSSGVGTVETPIFCLVIDSILRRSRSSRGSASVIATPSRPARPVRPMRCTYESGDAGTSKLTTWVKCSMSIPRAATSVATTKSTIAPRAFFMTRSRSTCDIPPCRASTRYPRPTSRSASSSTSIRVRQKIKASFGDSKSRTRPSAAIL